MNSVERAQRDMLFALVMEASRGRAWEDDLEKLKTKYHLKISDHLLSAALEPWEDEGLLAVSRHSDGCAAFVKQSRYGTALSRLMNLLGAKHLEFDWSKEEILTDVNPDDTWPGPDGWKMYTFAPERVQETATNGNIAENPRTSTVSASPTHIDWTKWGTILAGLGIMVSIMLWKLS